MTQNDDTKPTLREQVKTALLYLEWAHGESLEHRTPGEAHAYYDAVEMIKAALDDDLRAPDDMMLLHSDDEQERIQESRLARKEGYSTATMLDKRCSDGGDVEGGWLSSLRQRFV